MKITKEFRVEGERQLDVQKKMKVKVKEID